MAQPSNPDLQLVQKAVNGNRKAFTSLFNRYFQSVYNFALMLSHDPALAEDLTQEAFIRAHANLERLGPPWNFRAWIFRLTRNYFIDLTRKDRDVDPLEEDTPLRSKGPGPEKETMSREAANRVQNTLNKLTPQHREILVLRELNQFSYAEIGEILDIGDSNVKVSLHRARAAFQESYGIQLLLEDPEGECQEVTALLGALHDNEELLDRDQFVREHLKVCPECRERRQMLIAQSVALGAFIPVIPPKALAERILNKTGSPPLGPAVQKPALIKGLFGYGGGAIVLGALIWIAYSLIFNTQSILPNFPQSGTSTPTPAVLAPAAPTEAAAEVPPPPPLLPTTTTEAAAEVPPPPPPPPPPAEDERCGLFEDMEMSLIILNIIDGTYNLPVYLKMTPEVPGGGKTGDIGETSLPFNAWLGEIPAYKCDLQGFPDRLYCMFTLKPEMPGTEQFFKLEMEDCEGMLYSQAVMLPEIQQVGEPVGCHAGLDARACKTLGGEYRKINDTDYLCFCPP